MLTLRICRLCPRVIEFILEVVEKHEVEEKGKGKDAEQNGACA
jgi:hypothetical protein